MSGSRTASPSIRRLLESYVSALVDGNREQAALVVRRAYETGLTPPVLYLQILAAGQREVGERWHRGELTVAQEHWASEVTREQMQWLRSRWNRRRSLGVSAVVTSVEGERHDLAARMFADLMQWGGWQVEYLGGDVPTRDCLDYVRRCRPDLLGISVSQEELLPTVIELCASVKKLDSPPKILVGGAAAQGSSKVALHADRLASDALEGLELATELVGLGPQRQIEGYLRTVGSRIRRLRSEARLSQSELARQAGVTRPYLSAIEGGRQNITLEAAFKLATALQTPMSEMLSEDAE